MADRSSFRGGRSSRAGGDRRGAQRSGGAGGGAQQQQQQQEKPKKENILDLSKYMDKEVNVKFNGGRESESLLISPNVSGFSGLSDELVAVSGILKGYDQLMNLVLDDVKETMRGMSATALLSSEQCG